jgi:Nucleoside diphosphate kinase
VVKSARKLIGATNPLEAEPGTIRGDLAVWTSRNIVHGSDSVESGIRETGGPNGHRLALLHHGSSPRKGLIVLHSFFNQGLQLMCTGCS